MVSLWGGPFVSSKKLISEGSFEKGFYTKFFIYRFGYFDDPLLFKVTKQEKHPKKILTPSVDGAAHQLNRLHLVWQCCHSLCLGPLCLNCCGLLVGGPLCQLQKINF